jgi:hypothetical protein
MKMKRKKEKKIHLICIRLQEKGNKMAENCGVGGCRLLWRTIMPVILIGK